LAVGPIILAVVDSIWAVLRHWPFAGTTIAGARSLSITGTWTFAITASGTRRKLPGLRTIQEIGRCVSALRGPVPS
jgi:hypothetical protein